MAVTSSLKHDILAFLTGQAGPVTEPDIKRSVIGDNRLKQTVLRQLVVEGTVTREGRGTRGRPYRFSLHATGAGSEHLAGEEPSASTAECRCGGFLWVLTPEGWELCRACQAQR
jgi:hypothetical protein